MTSGAIEITGGNRANSLVAGITIVANRCLGRVMHIRGAIYNGLDGMTAFTGAFGNGGIGTGVAGRTVIAVIDQVGFAQVVHGTAAITSLAHVTGGAIKVAGNLIDALVTLTTLIGHSRLSRMVHEGRTVIGLAGVAGSTIESCGIDCTMTINAGPGSGQSGCMVHVRTTVDFVGLVAVTGGAVEIAGNVADPHVTTGTVAKSCGSGHMMESRNFLIVDRLGMASLTRGCRGFLDDIRPVDDPHVMAIETAHAPGILGNSQVMNIARRERMTTGTACRLDDRGVTAAATAIVGIGQTVMTAGGGFICAPVGMATVTIGAKSNAGMTFAAVAGSSGSGGMMLREGAASSPGVIRVAAFAASRFDNAGVAGIAADRDRRIVQQVVVIGTNIGSPGIGRMAVSTTTRARHPCMTYGTLIGLRSGGGMVLVAGIAGCPITVPMATLAAGGLDNTGVTSVAADRHRRIVQQVVVVGTNIGGPGISRMAAGTFGGPS